MPGNNRDAPGPAAFMRQAAAAPKVGMFTRLAVPETFELLSVVGLDAVVLDAEHGNLDRISLSRCVSTALSGGLAAFVRVPSADRAGLQHVLGLGATGVIVPHIADADEAREVAAFVRGPAVLRAHAGASRSSRYREIEWDDFRAAARQMVLLVQIDDSAGVAAAPSLADVEGFDGAFLGRISLSLELEGNMEATDRALGQVCSAFTGRFLGMSLNDQSHGKQWRDRGVKFFVIDSDQRLLVSAARARTAAFRGFL